MLVDIEFNQPFNGIIFSKGYFARSECVYVKAAPAKYSYEFTIAYDACGTTAGGSGVRSSGARSDDGFLDTTTPNRTRREATNSTSRAQGRSLFGGGPEFPQTAGDPYAPQMQMPNNMDYSGEMGVGVGMMGDPYSGVGQQQSWQPVQNAYGGGAPQYGNGFAGNQQVG